ncbi:hypothetical protein HK101_008093, partial [Irineochytrium annulatum]
MENLIDRYNAVIEARSQRSLPPRECLELLIPHLFPIPARPPPPSNGCRLIFPDASDDDDDDPTPPLLRSPPGKPPDPRLALLKPADALAVHMLLMDLLVECREFEGARECERWCGRIVADAKARREQPQTRWRRADDGQKGRQTGTGDALLDAGDGGMGDNGHDPLDPFLPSPTTSSTAGNGGGGGEDDDDDGEDDGDDNEIPKAMLDHLSLSSVGLLLASNSDMVLAREATKDLLITSFDTIRAANESAAAPVAGDPARQPTDVRAAAYSAMQDRVTASLVNCARVCTLSAHAGEAVKFLMQMDPKPPPSWWWSDVGCVAAAGGKPAVARMLWDGPRSSGLGKWERASLRHNLELLKAVEDGKAMECIGEACGDGVWRGVRALRDIEAAVRHDDGDGVESEGSITSVRCGSYTIAVARPRKRRDAASGTPGGSGHVGRAALVRDAEGWIRELEAVKDVLANDTHSVIARRILSRADQTIAYLE